MSAVYIETILNYWDLLARVWFVMKSKQDNDVTDLTDVIYVEKKSEQSWKIR